MYGFSEHTEIYLNNSYNLIHTDEKRSLSM